MDNAAYREGLKSQIREEYGRLVYTYTTHLKQVERLKKKQRKLSNWQIWMSALSTGGLVGMLVFSPILLKLVTAAISTALLVLNTVLKSSNFSDVIGQHQASSDKLWPIREGYISLLTDFNALSSKEIVSWRDKLLQETDNVYRISPKTDSESYMMAQKALKHEEEQFFLSSEIDQLLPEHLRLENKK